MQSLKCFFHCSLKMLKTQWDRWNAWKNCHMLPNFFFILPLPCKNFVGFWKHAIGRDDDLKNSLTRERKMDKNYQITSCSDAKCEGMFKEWTHEPTCDIQITRRSNFEMLVVSKRRIDYFRRNQFQCL